MKTSQNGMKHPEMPKIAAEICWGEHLFVYFFLKIKLLKIA